MPGITMDYPQREEIKRTSWAIINSTATSAHEKSIAALRLIEAHYWRAREHLANTPRAFQRRVYGKKYMKTVYNELEIEDYVEHWLWANGQQLLGKAVLNILRDKFGCVPKKNRMLPKGRTSYTAQAEE